MGFRRTPSEAQIETFVDHYNHRRYHESINNLTPADVYFGRGQSILKQRERIKQRHKFRCGADYASVALGL
ncbi:MAG: transposase [Rhodospirillaceae bacterium]|nr:transposase [Rhodospirillaceae bacterium]